jgi:hypothetical protein
MGDINQKFDQAMFEIYHRAKTEDRTLSKAHKRLNDYQYTPKR